MGLRQFAHGLASGLTERLGGSDSQRSGYGPSAEESAFIWGSMGNLKQVGSTGIGSSADHTVGVYFAPRPKAREKDLISLYAQSGAARRAANLPVDDALGRPRIWQGTKEVNKAMRKALRKYKAMQAVEEALKQARVTGTGFVILNTREKRLSTPLDITQVGRNDLVSLITANQFQVADLTEEDIDARFTSENYGNPEYYNFKFHPIEREERIVKVHHSRVVRFDGGHSMPKLGRVINHKLWGESIFEYLGDAVIQQAITSGSVAHLMQESSIPYLKSEGWRNVMRRAGRGDSKTPMQSALDFVGNKSIFRTMFLQKGDEVGRVEVTWGGMAMIFDKQFLIVAAFAGIPATHFWSQSPAGMNATGESDIRFYEAFIDSLRSEWIEPGIELIDQGVARSAGIGDVPDFKWPSILELSPKDRSDIMAKYSVAAEKFTKAGALSRGEFRQILKDDMVAPDISPDTMPDIEDIPPQLGASGNANEENQPEGS